MKDRILADGEHMNPQLDLLLKIQANEIKINECEHEKRKLPTRKLLSEIISDVNSMQEVYAKAESLVNKIEQTYGALKKNCEVNSKRLVADEKKALELSDDAPIEELDRLIADIASFRKIEEKMSEELKTMKEQLEKASNVATEIGKKINQRKTEYDTIKPEYDKLVADIDVKIAEHQAAISQLEPQVDATVMKQYKAAKSKINKSPLYEIKSASCKNCGTAISDSVKKKASAELFVACEHCGALLYTRK